MTVDFLQYAFLSAAITALVTFLIWELALKPTASGRRPDWINKFVLANIPAPLLMAVLTVWVGLVIFILASLLISGAAIVHELFIDTTHENRNDIFRATIAFTAQATVLGALVGLPITLRRTQLTREANETQDEGLLTDRINSAVASLGATKENRAQLKDDDRNPLYEKPDGSLTAEKAFKPAMIQTTEPNIEVRIGALLSLERIAQKNDEVHVHIMEIICAYIRENAPASEAVDLPDELLEGPEDLSNEDTLNKDGSKKPLHGLWEVIRAQNWRTLNSWRHNLVPTRGDIETALQVINRRSPHQRQVEASYNNTEKAQYLFDETLPDFTDETDPLEYKRQANAYHHRLKAFQGYRPDLRNTNLQNAALANFNLRGVKLNNANLQGADLRNAQMQGAYLWAAKMQGSDLEIAQMQGADVMYAQLQGAHLLDASMQGIEIWHTQMQGANLWEAQLQGADLVDSQLQGADLMDASLNCADLTRSQLNGADLLGSQLQNTNLWDASFCGSTNLESANLRGAYLGSATDETLSQLKDHFSDIFCGKEVMKNDPNRPAHWEQEDSIDFYAAYQSWLEKMKPIWAEEDRQAVDAEASGS